MAKRGEKVPDQTIYGAGVATPSYLMDRNGAKYFDKKIIKKLDEF